MEKLNELIVDLLLEIKDLKEKLKDEKTASNNYRNWWLEEKAKNDQELEQIKKRKKTTTKNK